MPVKFEFDWFRLLILFEIYLGEEFQNEWGLWFFFQLKRTLIFCCSIPNCFLYCFDFQLLFLTIFISCLQQLFFTAIFFFRKELWVWESGRVLFQFFLILWNCNSLLQGREILTHILLLFFLYTDYFPFHSYLILMVLLFFTSTTSFSPWRYSTMWWLRALSLVTLLIVS